MTALPPDPEPALTPGLEPGGGVSPGDTPPDSGSTTPGLSHHEHDGPAAMGKWVVALILIGSVMVGVMIIVIGIGAFR